MLSFNACTHFRQPSDIGYPCRPGRKAPTRQPRAPPAGTACPSETQALSIGGYEKIHGPFSGCTASSKFSPFPSSVFFPIVFCRAGWFVIILLWIHVWTFCRAGWFVIILLSICFERGTVLLPIWFHSRAVSPSRRRLPCEG